MTQANELLRATVVLLDDIIADARGCRTDGQGCRELPHAQTSVTDVTGRLQQLEERMDYFSAKWMEHDEEIHRLKRRQA